MKTIVLISLMLLCIPHFAIAQKGKGHAKKQVKYKENYKHDAVAYHYHKTKRKGPPDWAPANGYRHRYVFFPEHRCYYDNYNGFYIFKKGSVWVTSYNRPWFILNISTTKKVELNIDNIPKPQIYIEQHITLYN